MKIKDRKKYSERLINDYLFIKRKLYKLSYLLETKEALLLQEHLVDIEDVIYDLCEKINDEGLSKKVEKK